MTLTFGNNGQLTHTSLVDNATPYPANNGSSMPPSQAIQGKMLKCEKIISQEQFQQLDKNGIKSAMIAEMVNVMLKDGCIEFTMQQTNPVDNMVRVRARVFVTPNDQIKLLRENGVI